MSTSISGAGFPVLGQLLAGLGRVQQNFNTLTAQASSGLIANTYAGLGDTAPVALALAPRIDNLQVAKSNIDAASGPAQITQDAMKRIQSIAADLFAQMPNLTSLNASGIDSIAASARSDLAQVAELLNSQYGGVYVFAGQDSANPPVPNPNQIVASGFYAQISATVGGLSLNGAAATVSATLTIAGSNAAGTSPFSSYLSAPGSGLSPPSVATGNGQSQTIGLLASANTYTTSTGPSTTGSYMRDLMRALATVGSLTGGQANDAGFADLVSDTRTSLNDAISAMATDVGALGEQQASLTSLQTTLSDTATALTGQLSSAREVDMAATLTNLTLTQTQLQASYQLIATASSLSLSKFLPAG